jgi:hypothetical protein
VPFFLVARCPIVRPVSPACAGVRRCRPAVVKQSSGVAATVAAQPRSSAGGWRRSAVRAHRPVGYEVADMCTWAYEYSQSHVSCA